MKRKRIMAGLASLMSCLLVLSSVAFNCMLAYQGTVNQALGIHTSEVVNPEGSDENLIYFPSEYGELNAENLQKLIADTYDESVVEQEEGSVLLKNDNNTLPLTPEDKSITLFGHAVAQPLYKNASAGSDGYKGPYCIDLYTALTNAGYSVNDTLFQAYQNSETLRGTGAFDWITKTSSVFSMGEESIGFYTPELQASWENDFNDVAIVMLAREGGEGMELATEDPEGISQLALHQDEKDLLKMIQDSGKFEKTIVLLNSGNAMEVNWLDEYGVDACLWIGCPGQRGFEGVVNLLNGTANPSGSLTDTYAVDSLGAPSVVNGSFHNQQWANLDYVLEKTTDGVDNLGWYTVQVEGNYVGYKYYETRYADAVAGVGNATAAVGSTTGNAWNYADEVVYPFGYGLSYTTFDEKLDSVEINGDEIAVTVTVTNTGAVAGKKTVQIYAQTPYGEYEKTNKVEKPAVQLLDFGKTKLLEPGESETLTITGDRYLLASYDYTNAKGFILSEGDYYLTVGDNAHSAVNNILAAQGMTGMIDELGQATGAKAENVYTWHENFDGDIYRNSRYTGAEVTNQFDDLDVNYWLADKVTYLSRSDWDATYPREAVKIEATDEMIEILNGEYYHKADDAPGIDAYTQEENADIPMAALIGKDYDDPMWETYLNQFSIEELASLLGNNFGTKEIARVGKPEVREGDGPDGVGGTYNAQKYGDDRNDTCFPCENILASTFNKERIQRRGELMGEECLYLDLSTVWMPGGNMHRTPFGGRNFEYYSEDSTLIYLDSAIEVAAMESKGVHAGMKHMVDNDQENNRCGISVFTNEQALREGGLRGFEGALAVGKGMAVMQSFNRLGMKWSSAVPALGTTVVEGEWGFKGMQETDALGAAEPYKAHFASTLTAGVDAYCIDFGSVSSQAISKQIRETNDGDLLGALRKSAHDYLYSVVTSAKMNGYSENSEIVRVTPWWQPMMIALIVVFAVLDLVFLTLLLKKKEAKPDAVKQQ